MRISNRSTRSVRKFLALAFCLTGGLLAPGSAMAGLGVHLNDERLSRTRSLPTSRPRWEFYDSRSGEGDTREHRPYE